MRFLRFSTISAFLIVLGQTSLFAQSADVGQVSVVERKEIEITRTNLSPEIDGILDDEIWTIAAKIDDLHQYDPVDHGEASENTEFYIAYSERYLYIGAKLYDSDPSGISARQLVQGQSIGFDDGFEFILDTFNNGRTGYKFQVNPNGIRREGIFENPNSTNNDWTGIWLVESRIDDEGWTAEVAIPFNTLNFDPTSEEWGFTIGRTIARKQEELAWSSYNREMNPSTTGLITGIRDIKQGIGLDIIPSIAIARSEDHITGVTETSFEPSLDVFYKFTPNLTGALTLNTDFSATEADDRQVNLSRFSLFFPEKRDFFLQDVDIFSFGGRNGGSYGNNQNGIPFYSRRIGLSNTGQPVDIEAGVKLTGRVGSMNMGALAVQQGDFGGLDGQALFVGRVSKNILEESSVGAMFTSGDPTSAVNNTLAGVDFRYQDTHFTDTHTLSGDAWYQETDTDGLTQDSKAYGVDVNLDTQGNGFGIGTGYLYLGEDYNPALGFANRTGIESFNIGGNGRYYLKDHPLIRTFNMFGRYDYIRRLDNKQLQSENVFFRFFNLNTHRGDQVGIGVGRKREGLTQDFSIRPGIVIPAGKYSFSEVNAEFRLSNQLALAPRIQVNSGEFYNGDRDRIRAQLEWRPDEHLFMKVSYDYQSIDLPAGSFKVKLVSGNANYAFNSKWSWLNLVQYDNISNSVGLNSRLRWNPEAGENLYIVVNYNFDSEGVFSHLSAKKSEIALKYTKTLRY